MNILISGKLHVKALEILDSRKDLKLTYLPDCPKVEILKHISNADVLISRSETTIDRELIDLAPKLKIIGRAAVGVNNIDVEYASQKGILVINTPGQNTNSAAELTMGLLLGMMRKIPEAHIKLKEGGWDRHTFTGLELRHKRIGIVGLGNVGQRVARFAKGFEMSVFAYDPYISSSIFKQTQVQQCQSVKHLLESVDILTLHVPLNKETSHMISYEDLSLMPRGSFLINAARGGVISEHVILEALNDGILAGVAIDTWESEPDYDQRLSSHPKVYPSPHIGASTNEAQQAVAETIAIQVLKAIDGTVVDYPVNLPEVGIIDSMLLRSYGVLSEKLASLASQILTFNPEIITMTYGGDLVSINSNLLKLSFMKGFASHAVNDYVSYVNAGYHFDKLGIILKETQDCDFTDFRSTLKVTITGSQGQEIILGGLVFNEKYPRISMIHNFYFEVEPKGSFILLSNNDKPGVIGNVGTLLAKKNVNIDSFELSRKAKGGEAMALIRIDEPINPDVLNDLAALKNITSVHTFCL